MPRYVVERSVAAPDRRYAKPRVMDSPRRRSSEPVRVDAREQRTSRRLAMIHMAGGRDDHRGGSAGQYPAVTSTRPSSGSPFLKACRFANFTNIFRQHGPLQEMRTDARGCP